VALSTLHRFDPAFTPPFRISKRLIPTQDSSSSTYTYTYTTYIDHHPKMVTLSKKASRSALKSQVPKGKGKAAVIATKVAELESEDGEGQDDVDEDEEEDEDEEISEEALKRLMELVGPEDLDEEERRLLEGESGESGEEDEDEEDAKDDDEDEDEDEEMESGDEVSLAALI
jgi:hypothetical protein